MNRLPRPVKGVLAERTWDAEVMRGWARLQIKRRVRGPRVLPMFVAASVFLLAAVVWAATRPADAPPAEALMVSAPPAHAASCMPEPVRPELPATSVATVSFVSPSPGQPQAVHARAALAPTRRQLPPAPACAGGPAEPDVVGELMESVDEAWKAKDAPRMEALLLDIARHHEDDPRCAQALFVLGRLQLEYRHDAAAAAKSFHRALELDPPAELVGPLWQAYELAHGGE
jgi:hypothetical protein